MKKLLNVSEVIATVIAMQVACRYAALGTQRAFKAIRTHYKI